MPQHTGLVGFLENINVTRHNYVLEEVLQTIALAEEEMIRNGIVAVGDICNTNLTILQKQKAKLTYHNFIEIVGVLPHNAEERWQQSKVVQQQFQLHNFTTTLVPHAPYSVSENLFSLFAKAEKNSPISMHNQECAAENEWVQYGTGEFISFLNKITQQQLPFLPKGKTSLEWTANLLQNIPSILLVHNTFTTDADVKAAQQLLPNRHWVLCPLANSFIENKLPATLLILEENNENICLGTDSLASNTQLSIYAEMLALQQAFGTTTEKLLQYATANGAKALQMPQFGQLLKGTVPGLLHLQNCTNANVLAAKTTIQRVA